MNLFICLCNSRLRLVFSIQFYLTTPNTQPSWIPPFHFHLFRRRDISSFCPQDIFPLAGYTSQTISPYTFEALHNKHHFLIPKAKKGYNRAPVKGESIALMNSYNKF